MIKRQLVRGAPLSNSNPSLQAAWQPVLFLSSIQYHWMRSCSKMPIITSLSNPSSLCTKVVSLCPLLPLRWTMPNSPHIPDCNMSMRAATRPLPLPFKIRGPSKPMPLLQVVILECGKWMLLHAWLHNHKNRGLHHTTYGVFDDPFKGAIDTLQSPLMNPWS